MNTKDLSDNEKLEILKNENLRQKYNIDSIEAFNIIITLNDKNKKQLLSDKDFIEKELNRYQIVHIVKTFSDESIKSEMMEYYEFENYEKLEVVKTFSDKSKEKIIIENLYNFGKIDLTELASTLRVDSLVNFLKNNKEFLQKNSISPYEITKRLEKENQLDFVSKIEETELGLDDKRKIFVTLAPDAKKDIDTSDFPTEYLTAINMKIGDDFKDWDNYGKIIIDLDEDFEIYRGMDELISVNPTKLSSEDRTKLLKLCEICPEMNLKDNIILGSSTAEEYKNAHIWIQSVLQKINPEWDDVQKVAYIDNKIGKKISYSPDFDTEIFDISKSRSLWKIISSGYGVCNGIAQVEQYILSQVGIDAEMVSSGKHAFLKLKDIEIPTKDGKVKGDTILDPTWNMGAHRYGAKPENFCRSYEEIRKHDIGRDGKDTESHKNDKELASANVDLDEQNLRKIYRSIGIADKDGIFPIKSLIDKSKAIDEYNFSPEKSIKLQLELLERYYPEFAECNNSTSSILQGIMLNQENLRFNKCVVSRVYSRDDENKEPVLYIYADLPNSDKKFFLADKETGKFIDLPQKEFEERFECYERDMEKQGGYRPWEIEESEQVEDLTKSSDKMIAEEGDER